MRLIGEELTCQRAGRVVFRGVGFSIGEGEAILLRGRNGAGKTSLLRVIAGLVPLAAGRLALEGGDEESTIGEHCHFIGHLAAIKPVMTVSENLQFWTDYRGGGDVTAALKEVGLGGLTRLPARYLSAGQQRRLALARLIAIPKPVWLLDEPLTALDTAGGEMVRDLIRAHMKGGGMIIAATHNDMDVGAKVLELAAA